MIKRVQEHIGEKEDFVRRFLKQNAPFEPQALFL